MNRNKVFLFDLAHTGRGYSSEYIPLGIGCIKAYLKACSRFSEQVEVRLFKNPQKAIDAYLAERPGMIGLSNYSWNHHLASSIAREIKKTEPRTLIVLGGPNYPLESEAREAWFKKSDAVDLYIIGDGEESFTAVFDFWFEHQDIEALKRRGFQGCHALVDGTFFKSSDAMPRVKRLDSIPSPYLQGYFDEWLREETFIPMMETTRGCPFSCTFCEKGNNIWSRISRKSVERFEAELEYVAQRYPGKLLALADDNFGMYEQDVESSKAIARVQEKYDYPYFVSTNTGKNRQENILKAAEVLRGALHFTASVQSMDDEVLQNVKRKNIRYDVLLNASKQALSYDSTTRSEVIIGLPGDSLQKHKETIYKLLDAQIRILHVFTLIFLEGTELATSAQRRLWRLESKYRVNSGCFGMYSFGGQDLLSAEIEEVCVASNTMTFEDYVECRMLTLTVGLFYSDLFLNEVYRFLESFGIAASALVDRLHRNRHSFSPALVELYRQFEEATRSELWDSEEELLRHITATRERLQSYIESGEGRNLIFTYRGMALVSHMDEVIHETFRAAEELLGELGEDTLDEHAPYLAELKRFCLYRKRNVFDHRRSYRDRFSYDFRSLAAEDFKGLPRTLSQPLEIEFYTSPQQVKMMTVHGTDLLGIRKIFSRWDIGRLQRSLRFLDPDLGSAGQEPRFQPYERIIREPYQSH